MKTHVFQSDKTNEIQVFSCDSGSAFSMFLHARILQKNVEKWWRKSIKIVQKIGYEQRPQKVFQKGPIIRSNSSSKNENL